MQIGLKTCIYASLNSIPFTTCPNLTIRIGLIFLPPWISLYLYDICTYLLEKCVRYMPTLSSRGVNWSASRQRLRVWESASWKTEKGEHGISRIIGNKALQVVCLSFLHWINVTSCWKLIYLEDTLFNYYSFIVSCEDRCCKSFSYFNKYPFCSSSSFASPCKF